MFDWLSKKLQGGRYLMNLTRLEFELSESSTSHRARVIGAAFDFMDGMKERDFFEGKQFEDAIISTLNLSPEYYCQLYNALEDLLIAGELKIKKMLVQLSDSMSEDEINYLKKQVIVQSQALRLLMVVISRKVNSKIEKRTDRLKNIITEARGDVEAEIKVMEQHNRIYSSIDNTSRQPDFDEIRQNSFLFLSVVSLTW